jgi:predicted nucleic acid-binding protein
VAYCIDTSSLIAAWDERYPPENFAKFWTLMAKALNDGTISLSLAVLDELKKKSEDLHTWLGEQEVPVVQLEEDIQVEVAAILQKHPRLVMAKKQRFAADTFVIATAKIKNLTLVTEEKPTGNLAKPNIPDVCNDYSIPCINLLKLIRQEAWVIG